MINETENNKPKKLVESFENDLSIPRYDLTPEELQDLEADLVNRVKENCPPESIVANWIRPNHKFANIPRAYESRYFPEVKELEGDTEDNTLFLVLVDTRKGSNRVVHATTISRSNIEEKNLSFDGKKDEKSTGFYVVDDLIEMGNFTAEQFREYYAQKDIDLSKCISVETNFRIGDRSKRYEHASMSDMAYMSVFNMYKDIQKEGSKGAIFASANRPSLLSFKLIGLQFEALMGRKDLKTSESQRGLSFYPIYIPDIDKNREIFEKINLQLPMLIF